MKKGAPNHPLSPRLEPDPGAAPETDRLRRCFRGVASDHRYRRDYDAVFHLCLLWAQVWGLARLAHLNDLPAAEWAIPLDAPRRPDYATVQGYLAAVLDQDGALDADQPDQVRADGLIETAQVRTCQQFAAAGLFRERVWYFDGHTVEYYGAESIGGGPAMAPSTPACGAWPSTVCSTGPRP